MKLLNTSVRCMTRGSPRKTIPGQPKLRTNLRDVCRIGRSDNAYQWYQTGHDTASKARYVGGQKDIWNFRWEHAQARIAARRDKRAEAEKHIQAAKAILDKGTIPEQQRFFPYLVGYVALYTGDYKKALASLQQADQREPVHSQPHRPGLREDGRQAAGDAVLSTGARVRCT